MTNTSCALVIIGGGPAARAAALAFREAGGAGAVVMLSDDTAAPYNRPPLSKDFLRGESEVGDLPLHEDGEYDEKGITVALGTTVSALDTSARTVTTRDGDSYTYERCVIATGAAPVTLPVPGGDDDRVLKLRSMGEATALRGSAEKAQSVIVIGSGFIGCEAAASLAAMGKTVTQVSDEELPQLTRLGRDVGRAIAGWLTEAGVTLIGGAKVTGVEDGRKVLLEGRDPVEADLVLTAIGASPLAGIAIEAGLDETDGRVVVDEHLATSAPGVFAAGDVAYAHNATAGRHLAVEHWGEAEAMGAVAGTSAAGGDASWDGVPGFWSEIGEHTLKYAAWGDGWDAAHFVEHGEGAFTVWYGQGGTTVGVLASGAEDDYENGSELVAQRAALPQ